MSAEVPRVRTWTAEDTADEARDASLVAEGAAKERARIVAWLLREAKTLAPGAGGAELRYYAAQIASGEHVT